MPISLIPQDSRQRRFACTGGETSFPVTFPFFVAADLLVLRQRNGITTQLALGADYTVSGAGDPAGGSITLAVPALAGDLLVILSDQPDARTSQWTDGQALTATALNAEFARKWISVQQLRRDIERAVRLPPIDPPGGLELPDQATRAGKFLGFDGSGAAVAMGAPDAPLGAVARSGDTMTGDLTISKNAAAITLNSTAPTSRALRWRTNGVMRWALMAWNDAESGSNVGSTLYLQRHDDAGNFTGNVFRVERDSGRMVFMGGVLPRVPAVDPSDDNDIARKSYVDRMAPPGAVMVFARNTAPAGWLKANGAAVSRTTYAALFAAIGTTFGLGDGSSTFNLPDLRGEFIRAWDDGRGVDTGRAFASLQQDAFQGHFHAPKSPQTTFWGNDASTGAGMPTGGAFPVETTTGPPVSDGANGTPRTAAETRPRNVALLACIKF